MNRNREPFRLSLSFFTPDQISRRISQCSRGLINHSHVRIFSPFRSRTIQWSIWNNASLFWSSSICLIPSERDSCLVSLERCSHRSRSCTQCVQHHTNVRGDRESLISTKRKEQAKLRTRRDFRGEKQRLEKGEQRDTEREREGETSYHLGRTTANQRASE